MPRARVEERGVGDDRDGLGQAAGLKRDIHADDVADADAGGRRAEFLEAGELRGHGVRAGVEVEHPIAPFAVGDRVLEHAGFGVGDHDGDAGQHAARGVSDGSGKGTPGILRGRGSGGQDEREQGPE